MYKSTFIKHSRYLWPIWWRLRKQEQYFSIFQRPLIKFGTKDLSINYANMVFRMTYCLFWSIFLTNRKKGVVLRGRHLSWADIKAGVPQGSVLGTVFFLLYINNLTENLNSNPYLYADGTSLFPQLTYLFPMHPFSTPWKHKKTLQFSDVFRG